MVHVKPIEAAQARPGASSPGLAADRKTAATMSSDQPPCETDVVLRDTWRRRSRSAQRSGSDGDTSSWSSSDVEVASGLCTSRPTVELPRRAEIVRTSGQTSTSGLRRWA